MSSPERLNSYITWNAKSKFLSTRVSAISHLLLKSSKHNKPVNIVIKFLRCAPLTMDPLTEGKIVRTVE